MKKLLTHISAWIFTLHICAVSGISASAATVKSTKGMGKTFERLYDTIFGHSLDSMLEEYRDEIKLRIKTGIIVFMVVLIICAVLITYFLLTKKRETPDADDDDEDEAVEYSEEFDDLDKLETADE